MDYSTIPEHIIVSGDINKHTNTNDIYLNYQQLSPEPSLKIVRHSPDGFSWGYGGSGPAQCALAILLNYLNPDDARTLYQRFKSKVVSTWPMGENFEVVLDLRDVIKELEHNS